MKTPSEPQAKLLAWLWQSGMKTTYFGGGGYNDPTMAVLWREGWIEPAGEKKYPNGEVYTRCRISADGFDALGRFISKATARRKAV